MKEQKETEKKDTLHILNDVAQKWLNQVELYEKYSTYVKYKSIYNKHIEKEFGKTILQQISNEDCISFLEDKCLNQRPGLSKNTISSIKSVLFQILKYGNSSVSYELINKQLSIRRLKEYNKICVLSREEQNRLQLYLLENIDTYKLGIITCLYTGMRLGEICALKNEDINITERKIFVNATVQRISSGNRNEKTQLYISSPKTLSSKREIPICDFLLSLLKDNMNNDIYFINKKSPMEPRTYQYKFKKYLCDVSINSEYHFHTLRHTFATNCISSGMDPKCLSEILGHSDVKTTLNKYVHPSFENKIQQINFYASTFSSI